MLEVGECIDYRNLGAGSHLGDGVVRVGAQHDHAHPAFDVVRHVGQRLTFAKRRLRLVNEDGVPAKRVDRGLEGETCAQRCLLEEQHHLAAVERVAKVVRIALNRVRKLHDGRHLLDGQVGDGAEVAPAQTFGSLREGDIRLDAERSRLRRTCLLRSGVRFRADRYGFATHGNVLLPARGRPMLHWSK